MPHPSGRLARTVTGVTTALTIQMLAWLDERPRTYAETLDAWKTSCPRLSIWEDALADRLVRIGGGSVQLTGAGRELIRGSRSL
jgi:hypothetical protein